MNINVIKTVKSGLINISIAKYQLVYCNDTKECYFDTDNKNRIQLGCTIQLQSEYDKGMISLPLSNKLYIVAENNKLYRFKKTWMEVIKYDEIMDLICAAHELIPTTITTSNGKTYAPKTTSLNVYMNSGETVEDAIKRLQDEKVKVLIFTKTELVAANHNNQTIFNIPFPISNYDLNRFPIIAYAKGRVLSDDEYTLSVNQLILKNDHLNKDEIMTFVFNFTIEVGDDEINATTINNVRLFIGEHEIQSKREGDVWIDTCNNNAKQYRNGKWVNIIDPGLKENSVTQDNLSKPLADKIDKAANGIETIKAFVEDANTKLKESITENQQRVDNVIKQNNAKVEETLKNIDSKIISTVQATTKTLTEMVNTKSKDMNDMLTKAKQDFASSIDSINKKATSITQTLEEAKRELNQSISDSQNRVNKALSDINSKSGEIEKTVKKLTEEEKSITQTLENAKQDFANSIKNTKQQVESSLATINNKSSDLEREIQSNKQLITQTQNSISSSMQTVMNEMKKIGFKTYSYELTTNSSTFDIPSECSYNKATDKLFIFKNSVYMSEEKDYVLSDKVVYNINGRWMGGYQPITFDFIVFKGK